MSFSADPNYDEVSSRTNHLKNSISSILQEMENEYATIQAMLDSVDGIANEVLKETMKRNQQKVVIVAKTLEKLLNFMVNSSEVFRAHDKQLVDKLSSSAQQLRIKSIINTNTVNVVQTQPNSSDNTAPKPPLATQPTSATGNNNSEKGIKSKLSRDYLEEADIETYLSFATDTNSNIDPVLAMRLAAYARDNDTVISINSAYRSTASQITEYERRGGKQDENGRWVGVSYAECAEPGTSWHEYGQAVDTNTLKPISEDDLKKYGLIKPLSGEKYHIQPIETKDFSQDKKSYLDTNNK